VIDLEGQLAQATNARASLIAQARRQALDALTEAEKVLSGATQDPYSYVHRWTGWSSNSRCTPSAVSPRPRNP
jgi:hypothetical protein